jgi:formate dehydrogenase subunit gamma
MTATSFILMALTGLILIYGSWLLVPLFGAAPYGLVAEGSLYLHIAFAAPFSLGVVVMIVLWLRQNLPSRLDIRWLKRFGGFLSNSDDNPPARRFNAGQKLVFWAVILLGASVSASGLSLLFPFDLPMFAKTFVHLNDWGITGLVGLDPLPTQLAPQEEMQYAQLWHAIVAFAMMCVILAHIYIGTIGMQGAYAAMGSGEVDLNWAKEHHSLWVEEVEGGAASPKRPAPAE